MKHALIVKTFEHLAACHPGYKREPDGSCTSCGINTYNAIDDASTACTTCTSPKTTTGLAGQTDCFGK